MALKFKILILIPAYNAGQHLQELIEKVRKHVPSVDILIVNDGATDNTEEIAKAMNINQIVIETNQGKGFALQRGYNYAIKNKYDYIVTLDADLQHPPEVLPKFIEKAGQADLCLGARNILSKEMPFGRKLSNWTTSAIISFFGKTRIHDSQCGFRMISAELIKKLKIKSVKYDYESELLFRAGRLDIKIIEIPIPTIYRISKSHINHVMDTFRFIRLIMERIFNQNY